MFAFKYFRKTKLGNVLRFGGLGRNGGLIFEIFGSIDLRFACCDLNELKIVGCDFRG